MNQFIHAVARLARSDEGQDFLEYGFVMALIAIGAMLALSNMGAALDQLWWGPIARAF
jgi:Flp pilus assembly pilin Flp